MPTLLRFELKKIIGNKFAVFSCLFVMGMLALFFSLNALMGQAYDWQKQMWVSGTEAIALWQKRAEELSGPLTPEKLQSLQQDLDAANALIAENGLETLTNKEAIAKVGAETAEKSLSFRNNYLALALARVRAEDPGNYSYKGCLEALLTKQLDAGHLDGTPYSAEERARWNEVFNEIEDPLIYGYSEPSSTLIHYASFFMLAVLAAIIACASIFAKEYQSGTAALILSSKWGRSKVVGAKLGAALLFASCFVLACVGVCAGILVSFYGLGSFNLPVQIVDSSCPYALTCGQMCGVLLGFLLLITFACIALTAFLSAVMKSSMPAAIIPVIAIFVMVILGGAVPQLATPFAFAPWNALEMLPDKLISFDIGGTVLLYWPCFIALYLVICAVFLPLAAVCFRRHQVE